MGLSLIHIYAFLNGSGVGQPLGLFAATGGGTTAISTASLTADDVIKLVYALKRPYRKNAKFIMNDQTIASIRQRKDNNGAYMWPVSYTHLTISERSVDSLMERLNLIKQHI